MNRWRFRSAVLVGLLIVAGCSSSEEVLEGTRIAVLTTENDLKPDARIQDLAIELPPPVVNVAWPQQGGLASHSMQHVALGDLPATAWQADVGADADDDAPILSGPVVADGRVFAMDADATVSAYEAGTGRQIWRTVLEPSEERDGSWGGGVAFNGGRVFVATGFAQVIALDAEDGAEVWRTRVSGPMRAAPTAQGGRVFVVTKDNETHALDARDGTLLWSHTGIAETAGLLGGASPAVEGDIVVVPYSSGELFALRVENGSSLWSDNLAAIKRADAVSALADIRGRPVIDGGLVFAASHSGRMVAIDLPTGRRVWEAEVGSVQQPWIAGDFLFVLTADAQVVALTARDGLVRWASPLGLYEKPEKRKGRINWSGPILAGDRLVVAGSHGEVLSVSPYTGEILGQEKMPGGVSVAPAVAAEALFFLTDSAKLISLR